MIELAPHMQPVAAALLGEPNRHLSNGKELRYGAHGSLSVNLEAGTWFDHENKVGGGVLDLVERQLRSVRPGALAWLRERGFVDDTPAEERPKKRARRVVARYVYEDEQGRPRHRTVRWEPKGFSQERYEDGRWIGGKGALKGVERVLYHEAELAGAAEVIVTEGEKDCDRLRSLGLVATTCAEGSGKWQPRFARVLAGKRVVVLPDNDDAGRKHAGKVAAGLRGKAASVKVLELPGLPEKGDVSDWLDAGGAADELRRLIAGAEERRRDWRHELLEGDDGPLACEANVAIALRLAPELAGRLRFDELGQAVECTALPWRACEGWRAWTDNDDT